MYVKTQNNLAQVYPYSIADLRQDNPNTSFPAAPGDDLLAQWGVYPVVIADNPSYDPRTHKVVKDALPSFVDGVWVLGKSAVEMTQEEKDDYRATTVRSYELQVQRHMDEKVAERQYDSMISAATYATSSNPKYGPEGQACVVWRDAVWDKCYEVLAAVDAGTRQPPTVEELITELPDLVWP